ncbi:hypothetical protein H1R20_g5870, partial [Candolleomyces eurysporus]
MPPSKHSDKQKKAGFGGEQKAMLGRKVNATKGRAGFTIASSKDDDEDDDEWVSSESGAATPNQDGSDSETASEADIIHRPLNLQRLENIRATEPTLQRVETARQTDFAPEMMREAPRQPLSTQSPTTPTLPSAPQHFSAAAEAQHTDVSHLQSQLRRLELDTTKETRTDPPSSIPSISQPSYRPSSQTKQRSSRPPSTYSISGKPEVRPHPLIRGHSTGQVNIGKPALTPLTVVTGGAAPPQLSTSPASSVNEDFVTTTSPTSTTTGTSFTDGPAKGLQDRRGSISSGRSIATLPVQGIFRTDSVGVPRLRTFSTMSASPSSAALSALTHLPTVTRPPSPQSVVFFPTVNPHANIDAIHPLLPGPYLSNHLTVLARRTPLRESYDRVIRAKSEAIRHTH